MFYFVFVTCVHITLIKKHNLLLILRTKKEDWFPPSPGQEGAKRYLYSLRNFLLRLLPCNPHILQRKLGLVYKLVMFSLSPSLSHHHTCPNAWTKESAAAAAGSRQLNNSTRSSVSNDHTSTIYNCAAASYLICSWRVHQLLLFNCKAHFAE